MSDIDKLTKALFCIFVLLLNIGCLMAIYNLVVDIKTKRRLETYGDDEINIHEKGLRRAKRKYNSTIREAKKPNLRLIKGDKKNGK